ncbi:MAG: hypothetical protein IPI69_11565 [Bacteroidales bacterium]|nr:hypothetical protein [Bacteroidales bacterium]
MKNGNRKVVCQQMELEVLLDSQVKVLDILELEEALAIIIVQMKTQTDTWSSEKFPSMGLLELHNINNDYICGFGHTEASIDFTSRLYSYNFTTDKWERLSNIPLVGREHHVSISFLIDNLIYCKSQFSQNFWVYNIVSNDWTELDFPYDFDFERGMSTTDNKNRKGYFGLGRNNTIWEYDPNR